MAPQLLPLAACAAAGAGGAPPPIRIAFYNGGGAFSGDKTGPDAGAHEREFYAAIRAASAAVAARTGAGAAIVNVTEANVTQLLRRARFDVVIFPGGSGTQQADALGPDGMASVRAFVSAGGGYIGTCGGAFLAIKHLLLYGAPAPPTVEPWARGHGPVSLEFTAEGVTSLGLDAREYGGRNVTFTYWQGPIVATAAFPRSVAALSFFRTEVHTLHPNETTGNMVDTPAITSAAFGEGRVVLNSPHPEIPPTHTDVYAGELAWVLGLRR